MYLFDNDTKIIVASEDESITVWDTEEGKFLRSLDSHSHSVTSVAYNDGKIYSSSLDKTIKIWIADC